MEIENKENPHILVNLPMKVNNIDPKSCKIKELERV